MDGFKITYLGGIGRVTGSCTLVEHSQTKFLVDCGMVQGEAHADFENTQPFQFKPSEIKFIILTHAHLDHCGLIPRLADEGFTGKIYCTDATRKLTIEILRDSAKISRLYNNATIGQLNFECIDQKSDFKWGRLVPIDNDLMIAMYRSAHILGSSSVVVADTNKVDSIWFSGDVGRNNRKEMLQPLLKYRQNPDYRNKLVICESTYGAKPTTDQCKGFEERQDYFKTIFEETLKKKKGSVVIPAFSLQRTQDILTDLYLLFKNNPSLCGGVSVVCDSPLAKRISQIYAEELFENNKSGNDENYKYLNPDLITQMPKGNPDFFADLISIFRSKNTKIGKHTFRWEGPTYTSHKPTVYISSAGMCSEGPVVKHLKRFLPDSKNTIILTGYQGRGTLGSKLVKIMNGESLEDLPLHKKVKLVPGEVHASILMMKDYSGHADRDGLLDYLFNTDKGYSPPEIHLNHGDNAARQELKNAIIFRYEELELQQPGVYKCPKVEIPAINSTYTMSNGIVELEEKPLKVERENNQLDEILKFVISINSRLTRLEAEMTNSPDIELDNPAHLSEPSSRSKIVFARDTKSDTLISETNTARLNSIRSMKGNLENTLSSADQMEQNTQKQECEKSGKKLKFTSYTNHTDNFSTDSIKLNEICKSHPAVSRAQMSEQDAIGLDVTYGNYVIYVLDRFQYLVPGSTCNWRSGWVETNTAEEMIVLIKSIDVACTPCLHFGDPFDPNRSAKSTRKPRYSDEELKISRDSDGSIKLQ